jgi:hypothetical protein
VTPYFPRVRVRNPRRLDPHWAAGLPARHFGGGHMFYAWEASRKAFTAEIASFVSSAT